jgi:hypothetical protein
LAEKHVSNQFSVPLLRVISYLIEAEIDVTEHISGHTKLTEVFNNRQFVELFVISNPFFRVFSSCVYSENNFLSICTSNSCGNTKLRNKIAVESKRRNTSGCYFLFDIEKVFFTNLGTSKVRLASSWEVFVKFTLRSWFEADISGCDIISISFSFQIGSTKIKCIYYCFKLRVFGSDECRICRNVSFEDFSLDFQSYGESVFSTGEKISLANFGVGKTCLYFSWG